MLSDVFLSEKLSLANMLLTVMGLNFPAPVQQVDLLQ